MYIRKPQKESTDIVFGIRPVEEVFRSGRQIDKLLIQKGLKNEHIHAFVKLATQLEVPVHYVPAEKLYKVTAKNHQGVICYVSPVHFASLENLVANVFENGDVPLLLVLDRITDVRNFGAITRTAECAGIHAIVIPSRGAAQVGDDAMRTSAGALNYLPICRSHNLKNALEYLVECGFNLVACTEKADQTIFEADLTGPTAIVMGSEEDGISSEYLRFCNTKALIPMYGQIPSLNVSVAAGVVIFEAIRQRIYQAM